MSFNAELKAELCSSSFVCPNCIYAECLGLMLYAARFAPDGIKLQSDSHTVRKRVMTVARQVFGFPLRQEGNILSLNEEYEMRYAYEAFGYEYKNSPLQLNRALVEDDCCKAAFLRGVLIAGGYASSPEKGYHLEIVTSHYHIARQTATLLSEMGLSAGYVQRRGNHILYFKDSSLIEDVLTTAGAQTTAMEIMVKKVERDLNNNINRKVNCDTANLDKTVAAAAVQTAALKKLEAAGRLDTLPAPLRETAELRLSNPDLSLSALCKLHSGEISRPGLNGRMRRLVKLAEEL